MPRPTTSVAEAVRDAFLVIEAAPEKMDLKLGLLAVEWRATRKTNEFFLNAGTRPRLDLVLGLTELVEQVTVQEQAPLLNATTTELGVVIERRKIAHHDAVADHEIE
mgnify:CR=1 FL=1